jgi:hypothetical protein
MEFFFIESCGAEWTRPAGVGETDVVAVARFESKERTRGDAKIPLGGAG